MQRDTVERFWVQPRGLRRLGSWIRLYLEQDPPSVIPNAGPRTLFCYLSLFYMAWGRGVLRRGARSLRLLTSAPGWTVAQQTLLSIASGSTFPQ